MENLGPSIGHRPEDRQRYESILSFLNVSKRILAKRMELGLSQDTLGRAAGSKQSKISEIELMKGDPRLSTLDRIGRELGLVVDLVPLVEALKGTPFERPTLAPPLSVPKGFRAASAIEEDCVVAGTGSTTYEDSWSKAAAWSPPPSGA